MDGTQQAELLASRSRCFSDNSHLAWSFFVSESLLQRGYDLPVTSLDGSVRSIAVYTVFRYKMLLTFPTRVMSRHLAVLWKARSLVELTQGTSGRERGREGESGCGFVSRAKHEGDHRLVPHAHPAHLTKLACSHSRFLVCRAVCRVLGVICLVFDCCVLFFAVCCVVVCRVVGGLLQVPLQENDCDCGVYVIHYAKLLLENPPLLTKQ